MMIRRALPADLPTVIELAVDMVLFSVSPYRDIDPDQIRAYRRTDLMALDDIMTSELAAIFVAEDEVQVIGHVIVASRSQESSSGSSQAWIFDLCVRPDYWGRGASQKLMAAAENFSRELGMSHIGLGVTLSNQRALQFYRRLGYQEERIQMVKRLE
jgi:ribosomal protein S18 acetylase RimI-like enzyme